LILTLVFTGAAPYLPSFGFTVDLLLKSGYCLAFFVLLTLFGVLDRREWSVASNVMSRLRDKLTTP